MASPGTCLAVDAPAISVSRVATFSVGPGPGEPADDWQLQATMTPEQRSAFADLTRRLVGRQLAIVVDGVAYSAPTIAEPIPDGSFVITMDDEAAARALEAKLTG